MAPLYNYSIGTTLVGITNIELLATPVTPPKSAFKPYAEQRDLTSGGTRGLGRPVATWTWSVLSREERDQLRTFCTGASATVHIRTRTNDSSDAYKYYQAVMVWPTQNEDKDARRRVNFSIEFRNLIEETP